MPSITILPSGKYRAQVAVSGTRDSKSFRTKREATAWGAARETELRALIDKAPGDTHTLGQALAKFAEEASGKRRGERWERIRLDAMARMLPVSKLVGSVGSEDIQKFRDDRLAVVSEGTVLRELGLLSSVFEFAKTEWKWIKTNPVHETRKPSRPNHRDVTYKRPEIYRLLKAMGYSPRGEVRALSASVAVAFMVALRTGIRAGEACGLKWAEVYADHLHVSSKTPAGNRDVPITRKARRLFDKMRGFDPVSVFSVKPQTLDAMFRRYKERAGVDGVTFHDARHTAATWMVANGSINVLELCKIFGWTDPKMAMIYFNPSAKDIKKRMETRR